MTDADLPDREQLLAVLAEKALEGHVSAIKLLLEELRRDAGDEDEPVSALDALDNVTVFPSERRSA